ncbi:hypothetical protein SAMCFNEI73_Ch0917 [Sinorhizobium americanum]|uniref:Uncharacterized protein n=1 Tax=Sinorhizobium americanum TaxID=194963 RepID=A0A1L3LJH3_9HYPH|nr:hypothetical protein SAMCFNEI73_Ch0917 [Sinorhizobium americanum]
MRPSAQARFGFLSAAHYLFLRKRQRQFWTPRRRWTVTKLSWRANRSHFA